MTDFCEDCERYFFNRGDRVRLVQNHMLTGQVIGERDWESKYMVRVGATVTALEFDFTEIEPDPDFEIPPAAAIVPPTVGAEDNVLQFRGKTMGGVH